jgi:hypothetical protein
MGRYKRQLDTLIWTEVYFFFPPFPLLAALLPIAASLILLSRFPVSWRSFSRSAFSSTSAFLRAASCSRRSLITAKRARSALASSVLPSACSFWYRSRACWACRASRSRRVSWDRSVFLAGPLEEPGVPAFAGSSGSFGAAAACERAFAVWFGFAGAESSESSSSSSSSSESVGRSPASGLFCCFALAASLRAFAAARRSSRVRALAWVGRPSSSSLDSSSEESSSESSSEESSAALGSRG